MPFRYFNQPSRRRNHPPPDFPTINETSVCSSAPGKVILFGEHAVVYGEPAVAASLSDLCVDVLLTSIRGNDDGGGILRIDLEDLDIYVEIASENLLSVQSHIKTPPTAECAKILADLLIPHQATTTSTNNDDNRNALMISALTPLLYLVTVMRPTGRIHSGLDILVRSRNLPVGAGLGSSAAFSTSMAAALLQLSTSSGKDGPDHVLGLPDATKVDQIQQYAYYSEQLLHGTPSGIDNVVSAHGGTILFQRHATSESEQKSSTTTTSFTPLPLHTSLPSMLLVNTHIPRSTKQLVAHVRELYHLHSCVATILKAMGQIASEFAAGSAASASQDGSNNNSRSIVATKCLEQMRLNQHLLRAVEVSHPVIEDICQVVADVGGDVTAAKLTGAGGGGCVLVAYHDENPSMGQAIESSLTTKFPNITIVRTQVGGPGVRYISTNQFFQSIPVEADTSQSIELRRASAIVFAVLLSGAILASRFLQNRIRK